MKCMKKEGLRDHTRGEMHNLGQNPNGEDEKSKKRVFWRWKDNFYQERMRVMKTDFVLKLF